MDHPNPAAGPTPGNPRSAETWATEHAAGRGDATAAHPTPDLAPPHGCTSYGRGHTPHWIQVRLSRETGLATLGRASVDDDGWITVDTADGVRRLWSHHPGRLAHLLQVHGPEVELRSKGILAVPRCDERRLTGHAIVSVADAPSPCVRPTDVAQADR